MSSASTPPRPARRAGSPASRRPALLVRAQRRREIAPAAARRGRSSKPSSSGASRSQPRRRRLLQVVAQQAQRGQGVVRPPGRRPRARPAGRPRAGRACPASPSAAAPSRRPRAAPSPSPSCQARTTAAASTKRPPSPPPPGRYLETQVEAHRPRVRRVHLQRAAPAAARCPTMPGRVSGEVPRQRRSFARTAARPGPAASRAGRAPGSSSSRSCSTSRRSRPVVAHRHRPAQVHHLARRRSARRGASRRPAWAAPTAPPSSCFSSIATRGSSSRTTGGRPRLRTSTGMRRLRSGSTRVTSSARSLDAIPVADGQVLQPAAGEIGLAQPRQRAVVAQGHRRADHLHHPRIALDA